MFILAPTEATFMHHFNGNYHVSHLNIPLNTMVTGVFVFAILALVLFMIGKRHGKLKELIIPYIFFSVFGAMMYFTEHHVGNFAYFLLFFLWICYAEKSPQIQEEKADKNLVSVKRLLAVFTALCIAMSLYWSASVVYKDVQYNYDAKRDIAEFIAENDLQSLNIMTGFSPNYYGITDQSMTVNIQPNATVNAYFDVNIIYTLNNGEEGYIKHFLPDADYVQRTLDKWRTIGPPDVYLKAKSATLITPQSLLLSSDASPKTTLIITASVWLFICEMICLG